MEEYRASLEDLTFNSKPLINMLTVLAEENFSYASDLVKLIESQVYQVIIYWRLLLGAVTFLACFLSPLFQVYCKMVNSDH